nr:hypothetical protein [Tanacetum cinerariifolium]
MPEDPYTYVVAAFQALPPPYYVPGLEEPEQAPPSPIYIPYISEPVYPEYIPPKDDVFLAEEQPLPAAASPTAESPGYIPESDPDEDPEEDDDEDPEDDLADYPADHDEKEEEEEEPSGDDEEDKEQDEDDDDEEEEHPASADSIPPPPALRLLSSDHRADRPEVTLPPDPIPSYIYKYKYKRKTKGKGIIIEEEPVKVKRRDHRPDQIQADEELARRMLAEEQAELDKLQRERLAQEETIIAAINKELDDIQAMIEADEQLVVRL